MAEVVHLESEKWIPEFEQMQRINLFNKKEIRLVFFSSLILTEPRNN